MKGDKIKSVQGRQIFNSRGIPTIEAAVMLESGATAIASVPSGSSTGRYEAVELRDEKGDFGGKGVIRAVDNINNQINSLLKGRSVFDQQGIDDAMIKADGTENKSNLGANAILAVSLAAARAAARSYDMPLYRYIGGASAATMPVPMMNIINGGAHADNCIDIQEFMIVPTGANTFREAMHICVNTYHSLYDILKSKRLCTALGDEGGFAPDLQSDEQALELIIQAIEQSGLKPGIDMHIALDAAASEWQDKEQYRLPKKGIGKTKQQLIDYFESLCASYPIISIEDPLSEEDFEGFREIRQRLNIQIVGDDLFVTSPRRLQEGIQKGSGDTILIKPNQVGTLSETMQSIRLAKRNGYKTIVSHRSGDTADPFIADLAVALNSGQIKTGAPARGERVAKYNRLLKIELSLGENASYLGAAAFRVINI